MAITVVQSSQMWTGEIKEQIYLDTPETLDIGAEETAWFAAGGGTPREFADYLVAKGAKEISDVRVWEIRYQS